MIDYPCICGHTKNMHHETYYWQRKPANVKNLIRQADVAVLSCICVDFKLNNLALMEMKYEEKQCSK